MTKELLIRVHGVSTPEEASWLEALGVNLISVVVGEPMKGRIVNREIAHRIANHLTRARLCVEPSADTDLTPEDVHRMGAALVEVPWGQEVPRAWREALARLGMSWALVRVPADEDDDPSWVQSRIEEVGAPEPAWIEVEVCPNLEDGWRVIRESHGSELDAADLDELARSHAILFAPALRTDNVRSIRETLTHAKGFSFTLANSDSGIAGAHQYDKEALRALLEQLQTT